MRNSKGSKYQYQGTGVATILFIIFVVLKLTGNIDWSWWWVSSPLWISWVFILVPAIVFWVIFK